MAAPTIASSANPTTTRTSVSHKERLNLQAMIRVSKIRPPSSLSSLFPSIRRGSSSRPQLVCMAKNAVSEVLDVNDSSWDDMVVGSKSPVLVEFGAPWCGPCRMIAPVIEELAKEYAGKIVCLKVNTDESPKTASKYGIRSLPTVLLFKSGEKKESVIGAVPKSTLCATLDKYVEDI